MVNEGILAGILAGILQDSRGQLPSSAEEGRLRGREMLRSNTRSGRRGGVGQAPLTDTTPTTPSKVASHHFLKVASHHFLYVAVTSPRLRRGV